MFNTVKVKKTYIITERVIKPDKAGTNLALAFFAGEKKLTRKISDGAGS